MHTSRSAPQLMSIDQMYSVVRGETGSWGIEGYEIHKKYVNPQQPKYEEMQKNKGKKSNKHVTKRGHFLDDLAKSRRYNQAPIQHDNTNHWVDPKDKEKKPKSAPTKKMSYIDQIYRYNERFPFPAANKYDYDAHRSVEFKGKKWAEYGKKKLNLGPRKDFLQDYEFLGGTMAGPGQYNPHQILPKLKMNNSKPADMIKKHKDFDKFKLERLKVYPKPDVVTYKPHPVDYDTFGRSLQNIYDKKKVEAPKIKYWGTPADPKKKLEKSKSTTNMQQYNLIAYWPGKDDGKGKDKDGKKSNWMNKITKGVQHSIYH